MLERVFYDGLGHEDCSRRLGEFVASASKTLSPPKLPPHLTPLSLPATYPSMKPIIRAKNDSLQFSFVDHTTELQSRVGAWFSAHLAELKEPLRALVAQRLFIHGEGQSLRDQIRVELSITFQRTLRVPDDGRDYKQS